jgi:4-amino-4-deoxy-L-arabinose transferase-like glycosyltransferase
MGNERVRAAEGGWAARLFTGGDSRRRVLVSTGLATLLACAVLLPLLGHKPLAEWDEAIYAEVSQEILALGWLVPHWNGRVWLEKPPLMLWVTALLFKFFGATEFWARAGSAFSGVAIVGLLHRWLARRKDLATAWLCSVVLLGTLGFQHVARAGEMDVLLSLGCVIALFGLTAVEERRFAGWYGFWGGFAIALMTKGAASIVLLLTLLVITVLERWRWDRFGTAFWLGLSGFSIMVLPWHLLMWLAFGRMFLAEYLGLHVLTRALIQMEGHHSHAWYYLGVLLVSAAPFVLLYPAAIASAFRRRELRVWAVFVLVVLVFFSIIQTRLPHYVAPAYPALAMLTAVWLADWLRPLVQAGRSRGFWIRLALGAAAVCAIGVLATAPGRRQLRTAKLDDGTVLPDSRESEMLLKDVFEAKSAAPGSMGPERYQGSLLYWREGRIQSIATSIFYAGRTVQQVRLQAVPESAPKNRYTEDSIPLQQAVSSEPQMILLETRLLKELPEGIIYRRIKGGPTMEVGVVARVR